jgi:HPt (histidine-containing phosphotransfer) domain-containing protein
LKTVKEHLANAPPLPPGDGTEGGVVESQRSYASGVIKSSLADNPRMQTIIPEFVSGLPGEVRKMTDLLERNDLPALQKIVHQLRGASGGYGFELATAVANRAEEAIKVGNALESITAEINSLIEVIRRIEGYDESKMPAAEGPAK